MKQLVNVVFDWLEVAEAGHPLVLLIVKQIRKAVLANIGEVAAQVPPRLVAAMKR